MTCQKEETMLLEKEYIYIYIANNDMMMFWQQQRKSSITV
jgi:hypothetical protein